MEEKKDIKIRLSTAISMIAIFILIVVLGVTYYFGFVANKNENTEKVTNSVQNIAEEKALEKTIKEEKSNTEKIIGDWYPYSAKKMGKQ